MTVQNVIPDTIDSIRQPFNKHLGELFVQEVFSLSLLIFNYDYISTIFCAKEGRNSMTAALVLQFLSTASSLRAGSNDWESESISTTFVRSSKCLKRLTLTSEASSFNKVRKIGKMWSEVDLFPTRGATDGRDSANATLTCCIGSLERGLRQGMIFWIISDSSRNSANLANLAPATVLI